MRVKYIGESMPLALVNGNIYECIGIEKDLIRVVDEEDEDYLYSILRPRPQGTTGGVWEIIEDNENNDLNKALAENIEFAKKRGYNFEVEKSKIIKQYS